MICQIAYTNSNCSDLWPMFIEQSWKHTLLPLYMITDEVTIGLSNGANGLFTYSNDEKYCDVWANAIRHFGVDYFIYLQEDFVLYNVVDERTIGQYVDVLHKNKDYSFIRLLKATSFKNKQLTDTLFEVEPGNKNVFAMQPTIWRAGDYLRLLNEVRGEKWLEYPEYRKKMIRMGMKGMYHDDGEPKRGKYHHDSNVYPAILSALIKGEWNTSEYRSELNPLLEEYNIDPSIRGER